jgi:DNA-binding IclR family transcriptional regulator
MAKEIIPLRSNAKDTSQTLVRGLKILELIASGKNRLSIREIAEKVNLPRTIVHRMIATLEREHYLKRNLETQGYRLTTKLWSLGCAAVQGLEIKDIGRGPLEELASKTHELIALAVLDGDDVVYVDKVDCPQTVRAFIPVGGRAPAYGISTGKVILAYRSDEEIARIAASMKKFTPKTVTGLGAFKKHLGEIRERGYAVNWGEWKEDVGGVASGIRDRDGNVVASIGATIPIHRLTKETADRLGKLTIKAAAAISESLGYGTQKRRFFA